MIRIDYDNDTSDEEKEATTTSTATSTLSTKASTTVSSTIPTTTVTSVVTTNINYAAFYKNSSIKLSKKQKRQVQQHVCGLMAE
jgi:hypothetical protein